MKDDKSGKQDQDGHPEVGVRKNLRPDSRGGSCEVIVWQTVASQCIPNKLARAQRGAEQHG